MTDLRPLILPAAAVLLVVGSVLFVLSVMAGFLGMIDAVRFYVQLLPANKPGWNMIVVIVSPFIALTGAWYVWDQYTLRRRFDELVTTRKKSEFRKELPELNHLADRLPEPYQERLQERKDELGL